MKNYEMSFFNAPIAKYEDADGKIVSATVQPRARVTVRQVYQFITQNERIRQITNEVRAADQLGEAKKRKLPYITPHGVFSYRKGDCLLEPSGVIVVDLDHLTSPEEAALMRDRLFADPWLHPLLCFVSPSGRGVKALVPYAPDEQKTPAENITEQLHWCMEYLAAVYGADYVDVSGKDVVRSCFLCHDPQARFREDAEKIEPRV